jgi:hypothetical protein
VVRLLDFGVLRVAQLLLLCTAALALLLLL